MNLPIFAVAFAAYVNPAVASTYAELSADDKAYVDTQCLPVRLNEGSTAFRNCVAQKIASLSVPDGAPATSLSFDEQYAVQQSCLGSGVPGTQGYRACAATQIDTLQGTPASDFSRVSNEEIYSIQQSCYSEQTTQGVRVFRACVNAALASLESIPRPDLSALSLIDKNALQLRCSTDNADVASYRNCLLDAVDGASLSALPAQPINDSTIAQNPPPATQTDDGRLAPSPTIQAAPTVPLAVESQPLDTAQTASTPAEVQTRDPMAAENTVTPLPPTLADDSIEPTSVDTQPESQTSSLITAPAADSGKLDFVAEEPVQTTSISATDTDTDEDSILDRSGGIGEQVRARLQTTFEGLSGINTVVMLAALALPLCLIGFWLLMRGRTPSEPEYQVPQHPNPLIERVGPSQQRRDRQSVHPDIASQPDHLSETDTQDFAHQVAELFSDEQTTHDQATRLVESQGLEEFDVMANVDEALPPDRGSIGSWLDIHDPEQRLSLAIEFMIYWMAYADERYHPDLKQKIFALTEPDDHDLIKRWVLKQDVDAFASIIRWLQTTTTLSQREQILSLLMALLVSENALTPSQNTLLRFLGDAFGSGNIRLNALFFEAYGHAMPSLPRVDKIKWWDHQSSDALKRWDARSVSKQSADIQSRVKLGLPLHDDLEPQQILDHYQRAVARCSTDRFGELTERERVLVNGQLALFESARTSLMEAFA